MITLPETVGCYATTACLSAYLFTALSIEFWNWIWLYDARTRIANGNARKVKPLQATFGGGGEGNSPIYWDSGVAIVQTIPLPPLLREPSMLGSIPVKVGGQAIFPQYRSRQRICSSEPSVGDVAPRLGRVNRCLPERQKEEIQAATLSVVDCKARARNMMV